VDAREVILTALPLVVLIALAGAFVLMLRRRAWMPAADRVAEPDLATPPADSPAAGRPWWGNPWLWVAVCGVFVVLGLFVWPWLFGGTFLFLPFVWVWRPRPRRRIDPRANGHAKRQGESFR
jgi:hypothetical protein